MGNDSLSAEQQRHLETALGFLEAASLEATTYLASDTPLPEVLQVHVTFLSQKIKGVETIVSSINRRNKNEDLFLPTEIDRAHELIRDLTIRRLALIREEQEQQRINDATLAAAAAHAARNTQPGGTQSGGSAGAPPVQVVIQKPPLPPLPIPMFSGDIMSYSGFMAIFDETVHKNTSLQPSQKLAYLKGYLEGEAKRLIADIFISDANYQVARDTLRLNFGESAQTVTALYDRLSSVQRAQNNPFSIRDTYNEIENILRMLEHAGIDVNTDTYLYRETLKKWPFPLMSRILTSADVGMEQLREELRKEIQRQLQLTVAVGYNPPQNRDKPYYDRNPRRNNSGRDRSPDRRRNGGSSSQQQRSSSSQYSASSDGSTSQSSNQSSSSQYSASSGGSSSHRQSNSGRKNSSSSSSSNQSSKGYKTAHCVFCKEDHYSEYCERYKTVPQRIAQLGTRCRKCFREAHPEQPCLRTMTCFYCQSPDHNRAICPKKYGEESTHSKYLFTDSTASNIEPPGLFMTFLTTAFDPVTHAETTVRVLVDSACARSIVTEAAAKRLNISTTGFVKRSATGMGNHPVEPISDESVHLAFSLPDKNTITLPMRLTAKIADDVPTYEIKKFRKKYPQYEKLHVPETGAGQTIDILLGNDHLLKILTLQSCIYVNDTCQLMSTKFGYLILVDNEENTIAKNDQNLMTFLTQTEDVVKIMCDLDLVGMRDLEESESAFEERALQLFYRSIKFVRGRYRIRWPWRSYPPNLSENFGLAMGRLRALLKRLSEQPELLEAYHRIILQQIEEGVVEDAPKEKGEVVHYIPHHAIINLGKSTPLRPVYDGSATVGKGRSLNSCIFKGTKWLNSTVGSLVRFRKHKTAVTADIKHAFHQIEVDPADRDAVRFVWVHDPRLPPVGDNIKHLRFTRVAFGVVASPFLLYATLQYHLRNTPSPYSDILQTEMYADNLLASLPTEIDPKDFYTTTKEVFSSMSMDLTKWRSNDADLNSFIPQNDLIPDVEISVLGLSWNSETDLMGIKPPKIGHLQQQVPSKRIVLKTLAAIFDPLGWIAPFILFIRIFLRKLWLDKRTWDAPLESEDLERWENIKKEISKIPTVKLERMYFRFENVDEEAPFELHTFVDASNDGVGNVTYLRIQVPKSRTRLVMAKSRLTPTTKLTIPRLEFYALVLGVKVQKYITAELHLKNVKRYVWSDSKCVLAWRQSNKLLPAAIEKQVKEISSLGVDEYRYVPSELNPADVASRGAPFSELAELHWYHGPKWLMTNSTWPTADSVTCEEEEEEINSADITPPNLFIHGQHNIDIPPPFNIAVENFSTWNALVRRVAFCIMALNNIIKKPVVETPVPLSYASARALLIRWDQRRNGAQEPEILQSIRHFKDVQLFTDNMGLIRCKSRLQNSKLPWNSTTPIILVKGSYVTQLIVLHLHQNNFHVGTAHTLAALRKNYWLVHGRREVYRIIRTKCFKCRKYNVQTLKAPEIPPLPPFRITKQTRPFENTGIDVFGPLYVYTTHTNNTQKSKKWVLLFTCLVVRAVHFEILETMETADILSAIRRFVARRGVPAFFLSDNAPQFHLLNGTIQELWQNLNKQEDITRYFAENAIVWKYTPPHAPWMGGAYERLVQITKNSLHRTYAEQTLTEKEFSTTIVEVEAVMNSRPITYIDQNLDSPLLTPNDLLHVMYPAIPLKADQPIPTNLSTRSTLLKHFKAAEQRLNQFWENWSQHYLLALREIKSKSSKQQREITVGEVVLMADPTQRRGFWRKAVVEKLIPSADGKIRAVQIRTASGTRMMRPVTKLASLEVLEPTKEPLDMPTSSSAGQEGAHQGAEEQSEEVVLALTLNGGWA